MRELVLVPIWKTQQTFYMGPIWAPYGFLYGPIWVSIWPHMGPMPKVQPGRAAQIHLYGQPRYISMDPIWVLYGFSLIDLKFEFILKCFFLFY